MNYKKYTRLKQKETTRLERRALTVLLFLGESFDIYDGSNALWDARISNINIDELVKHGYLSRTATKQEFTYSVTDKGKRFLL